VVLTYHRVLPPDRFARSHSSPAIAVEPQTFDWQMQFIRKHFRPLELERFIELLRSQKPIPSRTCLVTFDDGWHDTRENALPILRRHGIPAVLFVATDYIGTNSCFWQERLSAVLQRLRGRPDVLPIIAAAIGDAAASRVTLADREGIRDLVTTLKSRTFADVESLLQRLERLTGGSIVSDEDRFLDWDEVAEISGSGSVAIGSHAMSHRPLPRLPARDAERELRNSRRILQERIGIEVSAVAYPNGDADENIAALAKAAGFAIGFTTRGGLVSSCADRFLLHRVNIHEGSSRTRAAFLARLIGLS
jgi:peptidoglycan/xylan/chitin deacetylase (PgdA/CDA1 family)